MIDKAGDRLKVVAEGRISVAARRPLPERLVELAAEVEALVERYEPGVAVLESLFHGVNPRSLIVLAQARGALLTALARRGVEIHEYSPAQVKMAVTGHGRADKRQVGRMVRLLLGLDDRRLSADASDALAVAICAANRRRMDALAAGGKR